MKGEVQIIGLRDFPLINPGDDIASLIVEAARSLHVRLAHGDIVVIGHKVISKSEGRTVRLSEVKPSPRAFRLARISRKDPRLVQLILSESKRVIKVSPGIVLVEAKQGVVCLNAGIDKSNVQGRDAYCLLPRDPDRSAKRIARRIQTLAGEKVRTIVTDTYSRPFRVGQCEFAIGASGLDPFVDYRGTRDLFGRVLKFKRVSIVDEIASAAELVMGQGDEGVPVAIVKGVGRAHGASSTPRSRLMIQRRKDLFQGSI
jgi:coenzyme F420-0:L-glutamate ligase/coenzyme F420-1:gamma-L-glutamate ligase